MHLILKVNFSMHQIQSSILRISASGSDSSSSSPSVVLVESGHQTGLFWPEGGRSTTSSRGWWTQKSLERLKAGGIWSPGADEETCPLPYAEGLQTESLLGALGTSLTLFEKIRMNQYGSFNQGNGDGGVSQLV